MLALLVSSLVLGSGASATPSFYTILEGVPPTLYEIDFVGGTLLEIATVDAPITAFDQEPGTGRLVGWAGGAIPGLYEIDPDSGATSLIVETTAGIELDELFYTQTGLTGEQLFEARYSIEPTTGVITQTLGPNSDPLTALAVAPDGETYFAINGDRLWDSNGPIAELFGQGIDAWVADETTLHSVGRAFESVATLGSTSWNSAVTIETRDFATPSLVRTSLGLVFGSPGHGAPKPLGIAVLPEPGTGWLVATGFGLIAVSSALRR
jgi:hypothetical protein